MNSKNATSLLIGKLSSCGLYSIYSQAFELATGYHLDLQDQVVGDTMAVPIRVGGMEPIFLTVQGESSGKEASIRGLLTSFAMQLEDEVNRAHLESIEGEPRTVRKAKAYIREHLDGKIRLNDIAREVGVCPFQLCRLFKNHSGMTMTDFVGRHRVERARKALQNPMLQIGEAGKTVGFTSLSQFNRNFLKFVGKSPSRYRAGLSELEHRRLVVS